ncbi:MAG TPA: 4-hydroxy-3-methylbut-2-enyl diphosphate reductase, partial [Gemmatimonadaceae bacterium]|nr:4-hydroxy-3-methylbut-2-enyl diphosphate reductase [Gemmatimonadaceae bacterium]
PGGSYLIVRDMGEAEIVCAYIAGKGDRDAFMAKFAHAMSPGFDPDRDLSKIGVANQTTMLANESLAIAARVGAAIAEARGDSARATDFRSFDTICSATQERQDAVKDLLEEPLNAMIVVGGYNSSNTISLAMLCAERVPTYHVEAPGAIDPEANTVVYRLPQKQHEEATATGWLPTSGPVRVGLTAGASTPNSKIEETVERILATRGLTFRGG